MTIVIVTTQADPKRPAMTWKVELPKWAFDQWWNENEILATVREHHEMRPDQPASTAFVICEGSDVKVRALELSMDQISRILSSADYDFPEEGEERKVGRPGKRVLVSNTSKDRRTGALTARPATY